MEFERALAEAKKSLKPPILIVHHNDADGLCSAAIAMKCLLDQGIEPKRVCIEKMFPEVVERIHAFEGTVMYLDLASGDLGLVEKHCGKNTLVLDHHKTRKSDKLTNLNPELYGISGEECTTSTLTYLFFGEKDERLAQLAVIGAREVPGNLRGLNRRVMQESGVEINEHSGKESYKTIYGKIASSVNSDLTVLGAVGYYQGGAKKALFLCLHGYTKKLKQTIRQLEENRKAINRELIKGLKLSESEYLQWFFVGDAYKEFGVKTVGTLCSYLAHRAVDPNRLLLGFMDVRKDVPGFMKLYRDYVKVSARAPGVIADSIRNGHMRGLGFLMHDACVAVGGVGDGHDLAASGFLPKGKEIEFIEAMEKAIRKKSGVTLASFTN